MTRVVSIVAVASCAASEANTTADISVELSSVTLADDCKPLAPSSPPATQRTADSKSESTSLARCAGPSCHHPRPACEQTSMQLSIVVPATAKSTTIKIKRVELLDDKGKVLEQLTPRAPTRWSNGSYAVWDQKLSPSDTIKASYALSSPTWSKLTNGRFHAHEKKFQLRVIVTIGNASVTVEKQSITPAMVAPVVVT